jgi:hypothetical protein
MEPAAKKTKTSKVGFALGDLVSHTHSSQVIGTHNGTFHCDEALAVFLLRLTSAYQGAGESRHCACYSLSSYVQTWNALAIPRCSTPVTSSLMLAECMMRLFSASIITNVGSKRTSVAAF